MRIRNRIGLALFALAVVLGLFLAGLHLLGVPLRW
jgi:hypothetical protein